MKETSIKKLINLKGRRAIVTGATGGFGTQISLTLAELGADLILLDRPGTNYNSLKESIEKCNENTEIDILDCDLEDESSRQPTIDSIKGLNKNINILINNAAFGGGEDLPGWTAPLQEQSLITWRRALEVNLSAIFHFSQKFANDLELDGSSSIINIASIYGFLGPDWSLYEETEMGNPAAYAASKGGLIQLTRWLATTLAPNIRVNSISPGGIDRNLPEKFVNRYEAKTPLLRMGTDEDIKGAIAFLSSDLSKYITGQNIIIDGGWSAW